MGNMIKEQKTIIGKRLKDMDKPELIALIKELIRLNDDNTTYIRAKLALLLEIPEAAEYCKEIIKKKSNDALLLSQLKEIFGESVLQSFIDRAKELEPLHKKYDLGMTKKIKKYDGDSYPVYMIDYGVLRKYITAITCYRVNEYGSALVNLGAAVEEEFARLYETLNPEEEIPKNWGWGGRPTKSGIKKMREWALDEGIVTNDEMNKLIALMYARDFNAHSYRMIRQNTAERLDNGKLADIVPEYTEFEVLVFKLAEDEFSKNVQAGLEILRNRKCALLGFEIFIDFIIKTSNNHPEPDVKYQLEHQPWAKEESV